MIHSPHDRLFKGIFSSTHHARGVLRTALPKKLIRHMDFRTLRVIDGTFVHESLRMHHSDLLFSVRVAKHNIRLYLLFEHQSGPSPLMAYRLLRYMTAVWDRYLEEHENATTLPVIVPVVLHHGNDKPWTCSKTLEALYELPADILPAFEPFLPRFEFSLDDLSAHTDAELRDRAIGAIPMLALWMLKHARQYDQGDGILDAIREIKDMMIAAYHARTGVHALAMLMRYTLEVTDVEPQTFARFLETDIDPHIREVFMTGAERLIQQGLEQGLEQGQRQLVSKLLRLRFGTLPDHVATRIAHADVAHLSLWAERILTAATIADVFVEP